MNLEGCECVRELAGGTHSLRRRGGRGRRRSGRPAPHPAPPVSGACRPAPRTTAALGPAPAVSPPDLGPLDPCLPSVPRRPSAHLRDRVSPYARALSPACRRQRREAWARCRARWRRCLPHRFALHSKAKAPSETGADLNRPLKSSLQIQNRLNLYENPAFLRPSQPR